MGRRGAAILVLAALLATTASAGPPFVTDDPVPVPTGHWEIYGFSAASESKGDSDGTLFGIDANYGVGPDLHLHLLVTHSFSDPAGAPRASGLGDVELGAKWRVFDPDEGSRLPQVAIYPAIQLATGDSSQGLGSGHTHAFLPLWLQWESDAWTTYGGVGYGFNPGSGNRDWWFMGWTLQRQLTPDFALGAELIHTTSDTVGGDAATGVNLGGTYDLSAAFHLLISIGSGIRGASATDDSQYYVGLQWTD